MADRRRGVKSLAADLAALQKLSRGELKERWRELYCSACPPRVSRIFLLRALAYRIQERALGGLSAATRRRLDRAAEGPLYWARSRGPEAKGQARHPPPARLARGRP